MKPLKKSFLVIAASCGILVAHQNCRDIRIISVGNPKSGKGSGAKLASVVCEKVITCDGTVSLCEDQLLDTKGLPAAFGDSSSETLRNTERDISEVNFNDCGKEISGLRCADLVEVSKSAQGTLASSAGLWISTLTKTCQSAIQDKSASVVMTTITATGPIFSFDSKDLNSDREPEVVLSLEQNILAVLDGKELSKAALTSFPTSSILQLVDFNADGKSDIVAVSEDSTEILAAQLEPTFDGLFRPDKIQKSTNYRLNPTIKVSNFVDDNKLDFMAWASGLGVIHSGGNSSPFEKISVSSSTSYPDTPIDIQEIFQSGASKFFAISKNQNLLWRIASNGNLLTMTKEADLKGKPQHMRSTPKQDELFIGYPQAIESFFSGKTLSLNDSIQDFDSGDLDLDGYIDLAILTKPIGTTQKVEIHFSAFENSNKRKVAIYIPYLTQTIQVRGNRIFFATQKEKHIGNIQIVGVPKN